MTPLQAPARERGLDAVDVDQEQDELERLHAEARHRIEHHLGAQPPGVLERDEAAIAAYWQELAAWPEWSEWLPVKPVHPAVAERWWA